MKEIPLTQNKSALVDDCDYEMLLPHKWYANKSSYTYYASNKTEFMHRLIMSPPKNMQVDHIDGNGLNNQRFNLRCVTPSENAKNRHNHIEKLKKCNLLKEGHSIGNKPCVYCNGNYKTCPKQRLQCKVSQACWKVED